MTRIIVRNQDLSSPGTLGGYAFVAATVLLFGIHSFFRGMGFHIDLRLRRSLHVVPQHELLGTGIQTKAHFRLPSGWSLTLTGHVSTR
jgi:hypothetical protein